MLQVTDEAVDALKEMRKGDEIPNDADVRIQIVRPEGEAQEGIGLTFVERPAEDDQVVAEKAGIKVFVASNLATPLAGAILDVRGGGQGTELELRDQTPTDGQAPEAGA